MKKIIITLLFALSSLSAFSQNLLRDDFTPDGRGGIVDWVASSEKNVISRLDEMGPDGKPVLRLTTKSGIFCSPVGFALVPGEPYYFSVYVRTKDLREDTKAVAILQDIRGLKKGVEVTIPLDTDGKWVKLEWNGPCPASLDGTYYWRFSYVGHIPKAGYLDICQPLFRAESKLAEQMSSKRSDNGPYVGRVTPVWPELARINASNAKVELYYPEELDRLSEEYLIRATIGDKSAEAVPDSRHRAMLSLGPVPEGNITLKAEVISKNTGKVLRSNEYQGTAVAIPSNPTQGKVLNNFVTELWTKDLANGTDEFIIDNFRQIYICTDQLYKGVVIKLDGETVLSDKKEGYPEAMRYLPMGTHTVSVEGVKGKAAKGKISLRILKNVGSESIFYSVNRNPRFINYQFGPDFFKRLGMNDGFNQFTFNLAKAKGLKENYDLLHSIEERGVRTIYAMGIVYGEDPCRYKIDEYCKKIEEFEPFNENKEVLFHENKIFTTPRVKYNSSEVWWKMNVSGKRLGLYIEDGNHCTFDVPELDTPMLAAYTNTGRGDNVMIEESYYACYPTEEMMNRKLEFIKKQAADRQALVPDILAHTIYLLNGWLKIGSWTRWNYPQVDMKTYYSRILQMMATDPTFANIGGVSFSTPSCEEDVMRFVHDAFRYYCIEGKTGDYSALYGMPLINTHITNGDFDNKLEGWTKHEVQEKGVAAKTIAGFGTGPQRRCKDRTPIFEKDTKMGDNCAVIAPGGNILSQKITGLEKGKYYQLVFCSFDYNQFVSKKTMKDPSETMVKVTLNGKLLEYPEMEQVSGRHTNKSRLQGMVFTHRLVFQAKDDSAEIEFTSLETGKHLWGINYVGVRPYYVKDNKEFKTLLQLYIESDIVSSGR